MSTKIFGNPGIELDRLLENEVPVYSAEFKVFIEKLKYQMADIKKELLAIKKCRFDDCRCPEWGPIKRI